MNYITKRGTWTHHDSLLQSLKICAATLCATVCVCVCARTEATQNSHVIFTQFPLLTPQICRFLFNRPRSREFRKSGGGKSVWFDECASKWESERAPPPLGSTRCEAVVIC